MIRLKDVADKANLSMSTVSFILNNKADGFGINKNTQKKVIKIAKELNYKPNAMAKCLALGKSRTISLVFPSSKTIISKVRRFNDYSINELLNGVEDFVSSNGYDLLIQEMKEDFFKEKKYLTYFENKKIDGMLIWGVRDNQEDFVFELHEKKYPFLVLSKLINKIRKHCFTVDHFKIGVMAGEYLLKLGHKRIGIIGNKDFRICMERENGFKSILDRYGIKVVNAQYGKLSRESGYKCTNDMFSKSLPPTAIFSINDNMAIGAIKYLNDNKIKVPNEVSVIGADGIEIGEYISPSLTTIKQPMYEIGKQSAGNLIRIINGGDYVGKIFNPELIIRESVVCAPLL